MGSLDLYVDKGEIMKFRWSLSKVNRMWSYLASRERKEFGIHLLRLSYIVRLVTCPQNLLIPIRYMPHVVS